MTYCHKHQTQQNQCIACVTEELKVMSNVLKSINDKLQLIIDIRNINSDPSSGAER